jgi:hypothetical protein
LLVWKQPLKGLEANRFLFFDGSVLVDDGSSGVVYSRFGPYIFPNLYTAVACAPWL